MKVFTARVCQRKRIRYLSAEYVDTTVKSGGNSPFAPTWDMVMGHKRGELTNQQYSDLYRERMAESQKNRYPEWVEFCGRAEVAITCYCPPYAFCHRRLLVTILREFCGDHGIDFDYAGEVDLSKVDGRL